MSKLSIVLLTVLGVILLAVIIAGIYFGCTPAGRAAWNDYKHTLQEVDDNTKYETKRKVEDTCRAMIASYEADKLTYEQYKDNDNDEKQSWAEQAKMRANKTAASYNNYILENSYVWEDNVPSDIKTKLEYID